MSSSRVKYIKSFFPIQGYTFDSANNTIIVTANNHLLYANADVYLASGTQYAAYKAKVTSNTANTFTVSATANLAYLTDYYVNGFVTGQSGPQTEQTLPRGTGCDTVVQSYVSGTGGATYSIDLSLDKEHWITHSTTTHGTSDGNTAFISIAPGWAYMRANVSTIGANTNLVIMSAE